MARSVVCDFCTAEYLETHGDRSFIVNFKNQEVKVHMSFEKPGDRFESYDVCDGCTAALRRELAQTAE